MARTEQINLLLDCLAPKNTGELMTRLRGLSSNEQRQLLELARYHRIAPLLYSRFKSLASEAGLSAGMFEQLRDAYLKNGNRNTLIYHRLSGMLKSLADAEIPVILLKGAYLSEYVYRDIGLRPMGDIDLLIRLEDMAQVQDILRALGYSPKKPVHIDFDLSHNHHLPEFIGPGEFMIDVHRDIVSPRRPYTVDLNGIWSRAQPTYIEGTKALALCPEDLLLHLIIHVSGHHVFQADIRSLYDIKAVLERFRDSFNWADFVRRAREWGVARCVYLTLVMIRELLALELPEKLLAELEPADYSPDVLAMAEAQLLAGDFARHDISLNLTQVWDAETMSEKMPLFFNRVFPSREELATKYPVLPGSPKVYLYYPVRIKDLFLRYGRSALGLMKKDAAALGLAEHKKRGRELQDWLEKE